jgi:hypothetical protein
VSDAWYPDASVYWVAPSEAQEYPFRYGDLFATPDVAECKTKKGALWQAVLVVHPSCELGAKATDTTEVLVARVRRVAEIGANQRPALRVGFAERDGQNLIALVNTFWLPPEPGAAESDDHYADFRCCQRVPLAAMRSAAQRRTTGCDDTRCTNRADPPGDLLQIPSSGLERNVKALEASRISGDAAFVGPRPRWAPYASL